MFIAVMGSRESLTGLMALVWKHTNDVRQRQFDDDGFDSGRTVEGIRMSARLIIAGHQPTNICQIIQRPYFRNPQYESVVLHPEHFLPAGNFLTVFNHQRGTRKIYVPAAFENYMNRATSHHPWHYPFPDLIVHQPGI